LITDSISNRHTALRVNTISTEEQTYGTITPQQINNEITTQHWVHTSRNTAKKYRGVGLSTYTVGRN